MSTRPNPQRERALAKVKKLLRLAGSSNPHEASAALRQAQALMRQFEIDEAEVGQSDVVECAQKMRGKPPVYIVALINMLCAVFGCESVHQRDAAWTVVFIGLDGHAQMAHFAFLVLRRQVEADRRRHLARVKKQQNRAARGDNFGVAWVHAVRALVETYATGIDPRVSQHMTRNYPLLRKADAKSRTSDAAAKRADLDAAAGLQAGAMARLARGLGGNPGRRLEHQS